MRQPDKHGANLEPGIEAIVAAAITEAVAEARAALLSEAAVEAGLDGIASVDAFFKVQSLPGHHRTRDDVRSMARAALAAALRATDSPERSGAVTPARRKWRRAG